MNWKKVLVEAICGFLLWTGFLTPYVLIITRLTFTQYLTWLAMQSLISPVVSVIVANVTGKVVKRLIKSVA